MEQIRKAKAIDALLEALEGIVQTDREPLRSVIEESGLPDGSQRIRYMNYNRQTLQENDRTVSFSVVAVIHNPMMGKFRLRGVFRKLSRRVFAFSRNRMDVFINNLRCDDTLPLRMEASPVPYSLFCMVRVDEIHRGRFFRRYYRRIRPAVVVCGLSDAERRTVEAFEQANEVLQVKRFGLPLYKTVDVPHVCTFHSG